MYKLLVLVLSQYLYTIFSIVSSPSSGITELSLLLRATSPPPLPGLVLRVGSPRAMSLWFPPVWVASMANSACCFACLALAIGVMPQQWAIPQQVTKIRMIMAATAKYPIPPSKSNKKSAVWFCSFCSRRASNAVTC